jgi:hypothetical protein
VALSGNGLEKMTVGKALRGWKKRWDELKNLTGATFDDGTQLDFGRRVWTSKKKRNYLRFIPHDLDDSPACLYAIYKALDKKSRLDPYLFFIGWIIYKTGADWNSASGILSRLSEEDVGFQDVDENMGLAFKRGHRYLIKVIEAAIMVFKLKLIMLSEGWDIKVYQKAVAMGYQSAIKKEEKKIETFQRCVEKKKKSDGTVSLRNIQRCLNLTAIEKSGRDEIEVLNKFGGLNTLRIIQFLEGMVKRGFLDPETGICKGKNHLHFRFSRGEEEKTCIK